MEEQELIRVAESCEVSNPNLSIVLYGYLGSRKAGLDGAYAKHCQDFAKGALKMVADMKCKRN